MKSFDVDLKTIEMASSTIYRTIISLTSHHRLVPTVFLFLNLCIDM